MTKKLSQLPVAPTVPRDSLLLVTDATDNLSKQVTKASLGVLTNTKTKIANYFSVTGELVLYDPSGGGFQINAPSNPVEGSRWALKNITTSATAVTIDGGGFSLEDPNTSTLLNNFTLGAAFVSVEYLYTGTFWVIV